MRKFLKEYRIEIIIALLALLGIFLLTEQMDIRTNLWIGIIWGLDLLRGAFVYAIAWLSNFIETSTPSDLIGYLLILVTVVFFLWRAHYRFMKSAYWRIRACPRCGGSLVRVRRNILERLISRILFIHSRRYFCTTKGCQWSGIRGPMPFDPTTNIPVLIPKEPTQPE